MVVTSGSRLGPYEIVSRIGAGGMGEVFKARDTRLDRSVAIKILPREFADNARFKVRFEREAKAISQLNHPHICTLHDIGHENDTSFLVMELIEGETLADRLRRGPLPVADVLRYGAEIASALDRAHRAGIVHRDVKPGNIMITRSGVKLLDFGLAKAVTIGVAPDAETQHRPLTAEGTIIGTFQYMAPEQLEGIDADARTDIFALGVVLYEMATGRHAFQGSTRTSLIAAIVASEPKPISDVQPLAPAALGRVVELCLRKDRDERWQSAHDVRLELESIRVAVASAGPTGSRRRSWALPIAAAVTIGLLTFMAGRFLGRVPVSSTTRLNVNPPARGEILEVALSPDGRMLAMAASKESSGLGQLWLRDLTAGTTVEVEGTADASQLFWSPDGKFVGFMRAGMLQRVAKSGGSVESICGAKNPLGASWNGDGTIIFAQGDGGFYRVRASGGDAQRLPAHGKEEFSWPSFLPDGKHFIVLSDGGPDAPARIAVASLDPGEPSREIVRAISNASYVAPGFLMYVKERVLVAQHFDDKTFRVSGDPIPIGQQIDDNDFNQNIFTAAPNGTVAFRSRDVRSTLRLRDRSGKELARFGEPADWAGFVISPDGRRALAERVDEQRRNGTLWLIDLTSGSVSRFQSEAGWYGIGAWAQDSTRFVYTAYRDGVARLYEGRTDSTLTRKISDLQVFPTSWVGDWIGCETFAETTSADAALISLTTGKRVEIAATKSWENGAQISPDGKWVAYQAFDPGVIGIFVQPLPPDGQRWQGTTGLLGGPLWSNDGKKLYCLSADTLYEIEVRTEGGKFFAGPPKPLLKSRPKLFKNRYPYGAIGNGEKFLFNELENDVAQTHVILNWTGLIPKS